MDTEVIERTFPVSGKAALKLNNITGSITLQAGELGQIVVTATRHTNRGNADRTQIEMDQDSEGRVTVSTRFAEGMLAFLSFFQPCDVDYVVRLPRQCEVKVSGVSCWLQAEGLEGELEFSTVSGELRLKDLAGKINASSVSGDLRAEAISGDLHLKTVSGGFKLHRAEATAVDANSVSGAVYLQTSLGAGPYHFQTVSGDVKLELPAETACRAELRSVSGDLRVGFPVTTSSKNRGHQQVEIGHGGPLISVGSISGNLSIVGPTGESQSVSKSRTAAPVAPEAPVPPPAPPASIDRQAILDRIDRGEISVEEGVRALRGQ